jgi:hypothetical protein
MQMDDLLFQKIKFITNILDLRNINYWVDCGTLLHLYRDHKLSFDDIDFGLMLSEYDKVVSLIKSQELRYYIRIRRIWEKEISFVYKGVQFDFIFCTEDENKLYMYSYKKNNDENWNWEWRAVYPKEVYLPLNTITYGTLTFKCPGNIEKKLALHYGEDWKIPKSVPGDCWTYDLNPIKDLNYNPIAVVMVTFLRDDMMMKIIPSYLKYPLKLYLIDQNNIVNPKKEKLYAELRNKGHWIYNSDFDIGLSKARNIALDHVEEPIILLTEDDIELTSNPYNLLYYFDNLDVGIVGGLPIRKPENIEERYNYELEIKDKILYYNRTGKFDIVENFFLGRNKVFKDVRYDNRLKLAEHTDFFLQLKQLDKWIINRTDNLTGNHYPIRTPEYNKYRTRKEFEDILKQKWNITGSIYEK